MRLRDLFTDNRIWDAYGDMDVYNDCIDDMACAWCGAQLTHDGEQYFDSLLKTGIRLLDTEVYVEDERNGFRLVVKIDDHDDYRKRWNAVKYLFECSAGYCSCEDYDTWFEDGDDLYDPIEGDPDEDAIDRIEALKGIIDNAVDWIRQQEDDPKVLADVLRSIGLPEAEVKKAVF